MITNLSRIWNKMVNILSTIYCNLILRIDGVILAKKVRFKKVPHIYKAKGAEISIGERTTINSNNFGYHLNMFSKCKLQADREGAVITIGNNCRIHGTCIHAFKSISIGNNCLIAANTNIIDANGHKLSFDDPENRINTTDDGKEIIIESNVWIGANCLILGGVRIGEGSVIAANTIVNSDVPPRCIFAGNPGKIIKKY